MYKNKQSAKIGKNFSEMLNSSRTNSEKNNNFVKAKKRTQDVRMSKAQNLI